MNDDHIPEVTDEIAILFGQIDLQIEEQLRSLFEDLNDYGLDEMDRSLVTQHMRWAYYQGHQDALEGAFPPTPE